jgi:hypothetical protein
MLRNQQSRTIQDRHRMAHRKLIGPAFKDGEVVELQVPGHVEGAVEL